MLNNKIKISIVGLALALTVAIHYGYILPPIFGESHWIHALHGRFCYIPIVIAAVWFGLRGGLISALVISLAVFPFILNSDLSTHNSTGEWVEIIFYFAIGGLTGALIDREMHLRKRHEETKLQLERSHKLSMVGQMTASIAHEIKNPLASIKGGLEIICDENTSKEQQDEFKDLVFNEIKRMDNSIKDFLDFARPSKNEIELLDIQQLVEKSKMQLSSQASLKKVAIETFKVSSTEFPGDREKMHQVLLNLLLNAIDASPENDHIELESSSDARFVYLTITDHGKGIDKETIDKIFDPFFTTKSSGTGLGLAVVKSIIESSGGEVSIESEPDKFTSVILKLPLKSEHNR